MKRIISLILCALMIVLTLTACDDSNTLIESYNHGIMVVNESSVGIKYISVETGTSTQGGLNADNSALKKGDFLYFELRDGSNISFTIEAEDTDGNKYTSEMFSRDFGYNALYYFYITDSVDGTVTISQNK